MNGEQVRFFAVGGMNDLRGAGRTFVWVDRLHPDERIRGAVHKALRTYGYTDQAIKALPRDLVLAPGRRDDPDQAECDRVLVGIIGTNLTKALPARAGLLRHLSEMGAEPQATEDRGQGTGDRGHGEHPRAGVTYTDGVSENEANFDMGAAAAVDGRNTPAGATHPRPRPISPEVRGGNGARAKRPAAPVETEAEDVGTSVETADGGRAEETDEETGEPVVRAQRRGPGGKFVKRPPVQVGNGRKAAERGAKRVERNGPPAKPGSNLPISPRQFAQLPAELAASTRTMQEDPEIEARAGGPRRPPRYVGARQ